MLSHTPDQRLFGKLLAALIQDELDSGSMSPEEIQEVIRAADVCLAATQTTHSNRTTRDQ